MNSRSFGLEYFALVELNVDNDEKCASNFIIGFLIFLGPKTNCFLKYEVCVRSVPYADVSSCSLGRKPTKRPIC